MSIGCHQDPCRCGLPCTCDYSREDDGPDFRVGCERHDSIGDLRQLRSWHEGDEIDGPALLPYFDGEPCLMCGDGILKSATISFGQGLVAADLDRAFDAARRCDLLVAVGTNLSVFPIANVVPLAARAGAPVVIVNGSPTEMDELATVVVRGSISEVLPRIVG